MDMPSRKLYENAIEITTKLKDKAKEETLKKRIEKRKANEEKKEKKTENANMMMHTEKRVPVVKAREQTAGLG